MEGDAAAGIGPFVMLLGQDRSHQDRAADRLGKMPTTSVRRPISLFSRPSELLDHSFCQ